MEKQNRHISAFEVNVYLSAGGYLGDKFQDKYFFVWPGSQRFNLDSCELVQAALGRIELLQDFTMTHSGDTIPWISGYKKHQTNERSFFSIIFYVIFVHPSSDIIRPDLLQQGCVQLSM